MQRGFIMIIPYMHTVYFDQIYLPYYSSSSPSPPMLAFLDLSFLFYKMKELDWLSSNFPSSSITICVL
jgi:hypothetical protein